MLAVMMLFNLYQNQMKIWVPQIVPLMVNTLALPGLTLVLKILKEAFNSKLFS